MTAALGTFVAISAGLAHAEPKVDEALSDYSVASGVFRQFIQCGL